MLAVCVARAGRRKGPRVAAFIAQWTMASQSMGRPLVVADFVEWWREPQSTVYRHLAEFREYFPEFETPQLIADAAIARVDRWMSRGIGGFVLQPAQGLIA